MGVQTGALKGRTGRPPVANIAPRGNHHSTVVWGLLVDADYSPVAFVPATDVEILAFCQDYPIMHRLWSIYGVQDDPMAINAIRHFEELALQGMLAGNGVFVPDDAILSNLQASTGTTTTNGVQVTGYYFEATVADRSYEEAAQPINPVLKLDLLCAGDILDGAIEAITEDADANTDIWVPVVLQETAYTQALSNAGNLDTVSVGGADTNVEIIGLWA